MKLSTKVLILVSVPILFAWFQLATMSYILSVYEKALVSAAVPLAHVGIANLSKIKLYLMISAILNQIMSICLALYFAQMVKKRIGRAVHDLKKLQAGENLEPAPNVSDEFALLDAEIRKTAEVLRKP